MDEQEFAELKESVRQMKAILAGKEEPARRYTAVEVLGEERVALIEARKKMRLSQAGFAAVLGVSPRTLQQWEQGRRVPTGAARTLIHVAARAPEVVLDATRALRLDGVRRAEARHRG